MKIQVKADGHNISIPIPTGLIFSRMSVRLWLKIARKASKGDRKYLPEHVEEKTENFLLNLPDEAIYALCDEIMRIKKKYGCWDLVEVRASSGEEVLIRL